MDDNEDDKEEEEEEAMLDLNHSPDRSILGKTWRYDSKWFIHEGNLPTRDIKGGTPGRDDEEENDFLGENYYHSNEETILRDRQDDSPAAAASIHSHWRMSAAAVDASHSSTSASEKSGEKRKRRSGSSGEVEAENIKPYECRFCPMKFSKSQALGGHMNRHRQEREREQLIHARQLVMQQGFSSMMMPAGQDMSYSPSMQGRLHQFPLVQRSAEVPLKYNSRATAPPLSSGYNTGQQAPANLYGYSSSAIMPQSLGWMGGVLSGAGQNPSETRTVDEFVPILQGRRLFPGTSLDSTVMPASYMVQPPGRLSSFIGSSSSGSISSGQEVLGMSYERNVQSPVFPLDSNSGLLNPYGMQIRSHGQNQRQIIQALGSSSGGALERPLINFSSTSTPLQFGLVGCDQSALTGTSAGGESDQFNLMTSTGGNLQLVPSSSTSPNFLTDQAGIKVTMPGASISSMSVSSHGASHFEGIPWIYGTQKSPSHIGSMEGQDFSLALGNDTMANEANIPNPSRTASNSENISRKWNYP